MSISSSDGGRYLTASEIAEIAGVRPSAVSNWRKRQPDFPEPAGRTPSGSDLFDEKHVRAWLERTGRSAGTARVAAREDWFAVADRARGSHSEYALRAPMAAVALIGALEMALPQQLQLLLEARNDVEALNARARAALTELLGTNGQGRLGAGFDAGRVFEALTELDESQLGNLVELALNEGALEDSDAFEQFLVWRSRAIGGRGGESSSTPGLTTLLRRLAGAHVHAALDPAAGSLGFLLALADSPTRRVGIELNLETWRIGWQRSLAHRLPLDLHYADAFSDELDLPDRFDLVLADPPFGTKLRPSQADYVNRHWPQLKPPRDGELAWLLLAIDHLAPGGAAYVLTSSAVLFRKSDSAVRAELVRNGAVEAVIALPPGTAAGTSVPTNLWVLRQPYDRPTADTVLAIDVTTATAQRRDLTDDDIDRVVRTLAAFRSDQFVAEPGYAAAVLRLELLGADVNLIPARWVGRPNVESTEDLIARVRTSLAALEELRSSQPDRIPSVAVEPAQFAPYRLRLRDLEAQEWLALEPGITFDAEKDGVEDGIRVFGNWDTRNEQPRFAAPEQVAPNRITEPGDIIVVSVIRQITAIVDETGGNTVAYPGWRIRLLQPFMTPHVAAALLNDPENARLAVGTIPRVALRDVELPLLDAETNATLAEALADLDRQETRAKETLAAVDSARAALLSLASTTPTRLTASPRETNDTSVRNTLEPERRLGAE